MLKQSQTIARFLNVKDFPFIIKDKNGNEIYYENSDGFWSKYKYDKNRNPIYYENSKKYWTKRKYDKNGDIIYYENSVGRIIDNDEFDNFCNNKIITIDNRKYILKEVK